ncbi:MAG: hypothetical protein K6A69_05090 [Lachnospiraceae bacterium]|nr:hypothetical protein [Lachnospiraceae bacterium]
MKKTVLSVIAGVLGTLGVLFILILVWPEGEDEETEREPIQTQTASAATAEAVSVGTDASSVTVMVYMNGSDLESEWGAASVDIQEMIDSGAGENVNVVLQTMGTKKWRSYDIASDTAQTYLVEDNDLTLIRDDLGQLDCTAEDTLAEFVGFCKDNYPAERYIFVFWDHGGGPVYGFGYDEWQDEDDSLTIAEMAGAFSEYPDLKFDIIGMDCCIMANLETCYALAPFCKYTLLSEDFESGLGWSYTDWMKKLENDPGISTPLLGKYIVDSIISDNETDEGGDSACMALFNESAVRNLFDAWKTYAYKNENALLGNNYSVEHVAKGRGFLSDWASDESDVTISDYYISDMLALIESVDNESEAAKSLMSALKASVAYYGHTSDKNELTGLAVSLPYGDSYFYDQLCDVYGDLGLDNEYITWLGKFVDTDGREDYYDYSDFESGWGGWSQYEEEYGGNTCSGGSCEYYYDNCYGYDEEELEEDWTYDYEEEIWYMYEEGLLYLYDEEEDMYYCYDEEEDAVYYYDEYDDEWYFYE